MKTQPDEDEYETAKRRLQEMEEINRLTLEQLEKEAKSQPVSLNFYQKIIKLLALSEDYSFNCRCW